MPHQWPDDTQRLLIIGRTGSGKTTAGIYNLSGRNWDSKPWVIFDTKGDKEIRKISAIKGVKVIDIAEQPKGPGLYIVRPRPDQKAEIDAFLWKILARENVGLYFDEGYMADVDALNAILTQGRSKNIPVVILTQRPSWITRFCFSEADFFQVFALNDERDRKTVQYFIPKDRANLEDRLPKFHSLWYDVGQDQVTKLSPTPPSDRILATFKARLAPKRMVI